MRSRVGSSPASPPLIKGVYKMSKTASEVRYTRPLKPAYKRNIQPFAGSAASGKCVDPIARKVALDSVKKERAGKETSK